MGDLTATDPRDRMLALKDALEAGRRELAGPIAAALEQEPHQKVRAAMVYTLGRLDAAGHVGLLARLTDDEVADIRLRAVEALATVDDPAVYPTLVRCLGVDADPRVKDHAAKRLLGLGRDQFLAILKQMQLATQPWQREAAVLAAQLFNSPHVVPLLKYAAEHEHGAIQEAARQGIAQLAGRGNEAAKRVLEALERARPALDPEAPQGEDGGTFDDTYTGNRIIKIDMEISPFEDASAPMVEPMPAAQIDVVIRPEFVPLPQVSGDDAPQVDFGTPVAAPASRPPVEPPPAAPPAALMCPLCRVPAAAGSRQCPKCSLILAS
jgi:hypothetical protein